MSIRFPLIYLRDPNDFRQNLQVIENYVRNIILAILKHFTMTRFTS